MRNLRPAGRLAAAAAIAVGTVALAAPAGASAATPAGSCYFYDNIYNEPGACQDESTNYSESGVSVWNSPYDPAVVVSTGSAGHVFATSLQYVSDGALAGCDNGVQTRYWYQGEDKASGLSGWVPDCYLNGEPS
jgi:hypothetical protein